MKKIIISIATISVFIFTSCFTDSDTATVKINLGNIPLAKVEKKSIIDRFVALFLKEAVAQAHPSDLDVTIVHLGAFNANNQLLASQRISSDNYPENNTVEFDVPAGVRRKIVVLGEATDPDGEPGDEDENIVGYYGVSIAVDLVAGESETVTIEMENSLYDFPGFIINGGNAHPNKLTPAEWTHIVGASGYNIYDDEKNPITYVTKNKYLFEEGGYHLIRIDFGFANIKSNYINFYVQNSSS